MAFDFLKNSFVPDSAALLQPLNSVHLAEGAKTFFNKQAAKSKEINPANGAKYTSSIKSLHKNKTLIMLTLVAMSVNAKYFILIFC